MVYFICGDIPLLLKYEEILKEVREKNIGIEEKIFDASQGEEESFLHAISTNSIFASKEIIILKRAESIKKLEKFVGYFQEFNLSQKEIIVLYEEILDDFGRSANKLSSKVQSIVEKVAKIIFARKETEKKGIHFYVEKELKTSSSQAEKFCEIVGEDFLKIKQEIEKVKNYLNGEAFSIDKILPIVTKNNEYNLKSLIEKFLQNRKYIELIEFLNVEKEYMSFLYGLSEEINIILKLKLLQKRGNIRSGMSYKHFKENIYPSISRYFKRERGDYIREYPLFLKFSIVEEYEEEFLIEKIREILIAEYNIKSGKIQEDIEIQKMIISFFRGEE